MPEFTEQQPFARAAIDSSTLISFLRVNRVDLLVAYPAKFMVPLQVADEVLWPDQKGRLRDALQRGSLESCAISGANEGDTFLELTDDSSLGSGERSVIAIGLWRNWAMAMDDKDAIRAAVRQTHTLGKKPRIIRTRDILGHLVAAGVLTREEADTLVEEMD